MKKISERLLQVPHSVRIMGFGADMCHSFGEGPAFSLHFASAGPSNPGQGCPGCTWKVYQQPKSASGCEINIRLEVCCKLSQHVHAWSSLQTQLFIHCCWKSIDVTRARHLQLGAVSVMPQPCTSKQVIGCCRIGINDLLRLLMPNYGKLRLVLGDMPFEQKRKTC